MAYSALPAVTKSVLPPVPPKAALLTLDATLRLPSCAPAEEKTWTVPEEPEAT